MEIHFYLSFFDIAFDEELHFVVKGATPQNEDIFHHSVVKGANPQNEDIFHHSVVKSANPPKRRHFSPLYYK
jgi:hypothetical protein